MSRPIDQWMLYAKQKRRYFFFYEEKVLDLTQFICIHPGGKKALANYIYKDITEIIFKVFHHKREHTLQVLLKYQIGTILNKKPTNKNNENLSNRVEPPKQKKKVCFHKKFLLEEENDELQESMQKVSLKKASTSKKKSHHSKDKPAKKEKKSNSKPYIASIKSIKSIKAIKQRPFSEDISYDSTKAQTEPPPMKQKDLNSFVFQDEFDEQKPIFHVPILQIKYMAQLLHPQIGQYQMF